MLDDCCNPDRVKAPKRNWFVRLWMLWRIRRRVRRALKNYQFPVITAPPVLPLNKLVDVQPMRADIKEKLWQNL
jgi:hypothetical protein